MPIPPPQPRLSPPPEWRGEGLLFLVGCSRSGTTWLQQMLGAHPAIATAQESHLFSHVLGPLFKKWDQLLQTDLGRLVGLPAYLTERDLLMLARDITHQVLSRAEGYSSADFFLEKTPDHILHTRLIHRIFPAARFLYITRRPADVVESLLHARRSWGRSWAPRSSLTAAYTWRRAARAGEQQLTALPPALWHQLRYEDLKSAPAPELDRILRFLELERSPQLIERMLEGMGPLPLYGHHAAAAGPTHREPSGFRRAHKGSLGPLQRAAVHLICQPYKRRLGY